MIRKLLFSLFLLAGSTGFLFGQATEQCGTVENTRRLQSLYPDYPSDTEFEAWIARHLEEHPELKAGGIITIPTVVHVIHTGGSDSISFAQVQSQIDVLNEDFRRLNSDTTSTPVSFRPVAADCEIEFCLVQRDPDDNATNGVDYVRWVTSSAPFSTGYIDGTIKPATVWDPDDYFNFWVADLNPGLLGYAQFPSGSGLPGMGGSFGFGSTDGIVCDYQNVGRPPENPFGGGYLGRTATHEVGHWIGLRHIWGDGGCGASDYCDDTPESDNANYGCLPSHSSCGTIDMVQNYMDYSGDGCMNLFTLDQKERMMVVMAVSPRRNSLLSSEKCLSPLVAPRCDFLASTDRACPGEPVALYDDSRFVPTTWNWNIPGAIPSTSTDQNPVVTFPAPGYYEVSLTVSNVYGSDSLTKDTFIVVSSGSNGVVFREDFEMNTLSSWTVDNPDATAGWTTDTVGGNAPGQFAAVSELFGYASPGAKDAIISPVFDLTGWTGAELSFEYAYRLVPSGSSDILRVYISTDGGSTFPDTIFTGVDTGGNFVTSFASGAAFRPSNSGHWCGIGSNPDCPVIDLSAYDGMNNIALKFETERDSGNNMYLDNILVTGLCDNLEFAPIVEFESDRERGCPGTEITFTDLSLNMPTTWAWTFEGGSPGTSSMENPTIIYDSIGSWDVTLIVSNSSGSDTIYLDDYVTIAAAPATPTITEVGSTLVASDGIAWQWYLNGSITGFTDQTITPGGAAEYTVVVTDSNGCTATSDPFPWGLGSSVDEALSNTLLKVYPNPNNGAFKIELQDHMIEAITLFDALGRKSYESRSMTSSSVEVNLDQLSSGIYFLKVHTGDHILTKRVRIE